MRRGHCIIWIGLLLAAAGAAFAQTGQERAAEDRGSGRLVIVADIVGAIGPPSTRFLESAIETAQERKADALVMRMNTPGGLVTSMREMVAAILDSPVPVIGYVSPPGAHAASAGTYILYATHVAAMAPGTNLGAATPVQIGGGGLPGLSPKKEDDAGKKDGESADDAEKKSDGAEKKDEGTSKPASGSAMENKATNDAVAFIRSLAELRDRNADWAEEAVRQASSLSAEKAVEMDVIDFVAADMTAVLDQADGRHVDVRGADRTVHTKGARVERIEPGIVTEILGVLANPNVAFILMLIGIYGLIFELANPGSIGPGLIGAISLVLALYALHQLPLDYAGLALVLLGVAFMVAEAVTPAFGAFGVAGLVAFVIGSMMLIDTDVPAYQLSWSVIAGTSIVSGSLLVFLLGYMWRAQRQSAEAGPQHMIGSEAEVLDWSGAEGHVWAQGERWSARGLGPFSKGELVRIEAVDGLTLQVAPMQPQTEPVHAKP